MGGRVPGIGGGERHFVISPGLFRARQRRGNSFRVETKCFRSHERETRSGRPGESKGTNGAGSDAAEWILIMSRVSIGLRR